MVEVTNVPVEKIQAGENALRMEFEEQDLDDLVASIRRLGILVPLVVTKAGDEFLIVAGHRRFQAAMRIGLAEVPVIVHDLDQAKVKEVSFAENLFRQDLSPVEVAAGLRDILKTETMAVDELAAAVHHTKHWVTSMVNMLDWPDDVLKSIHSGWLSLSAGSNLALITDDVYRDFLLRNARDGGATARTTAAWLQAWRSMAPPEEAVASEPEGVGRASIPAIPQAPCLCCLQTFRTDELAHVAVCISCINVIRGVGANR